MNLLAFDILERLQLKHPKSISLEEVWNYGNEKRFFLRYTEGKKNKNKITDISDIKNNYNMYEKHVKDGSLIQIAEAICSNAGCVIYFDKEYIYGEYIEGEPICLLRRGLCGKRFLIDKNSKKIYVKKTFQNWICVNENDMYKWYPFNGKESKFFTEIVECIRKMNCFSEENLLIEMNLEDDNLMFTDARYCSLGFDFSDIINLFDEKKQIITLKGDYLNFDIAKTRIDGFDVDNYYEIEKNIIVNNGAMLSHYITYNINYINNLYILS